MTIARSLLTPIPTEREIETLKGIFSTMQKLFVLSSNPDKGAFEITKGERTFNELPATFAKYHEAKKQSVQRGRGGGEEGEDLKGKCKVPNAENERCRIGTRTHLAAQKNLLRVKHGF